MMCQEAWQTLESGKSTGAARRRGCLLGSTGKSRSNDIVAKAVLCAIRNAPRRVGPRGCEPGWEPGKAFPRQTPLKTSRGRPEGRPGDTGLWGAAGPSRREPGLLGKLQVGRSGWIAKWEAEAATQEAGPRARGAFRFQSRARPGAQTGQDGSAMHGPRLPPSGASTGRVSGPWAGGRRAGRLARCSQVPGGHVGWHLLRPLLWLRSISHQRQHGRRPRLRGRGGDAWKEEDAHAEGGCGTETRKPRREAKR